VQCFGNGETPAITNEPGCVRQLKAPRQNLVQMVSPAVRRVAIPPLDEFAFDALVVSGESFRRFHKPVRLHHTFDRHWVNYYYYLI
jgi:hypothetical protein